MTLSTFIPEHIAALHTWEFEEVRDSHVTELQPLSFESDIKTSRFLF